MPGLAEWTPIQVNFPQQALTAEDFSVPTVDFRQYFNKPSTPSDADIQREATEFQSQREGLLKNMLLYQKEQNLADQLMLARAEAAQRGINMSNQTPTPNQTPNQLPNYLTYGLNNFKGNKYSQDLRMKDGYIDCSSLIGRSLKGAGYNVNPGMTTATMGNELIRAGFSKRAFNPDDLQAGDILWRNGHAAFYLGNGKVFGGHTKTGASELPLYKKNGNQLFNFTHVFRQSI